MNIYKQYENNVADHDKIGQQSFSTPKPPFILMEPNNGSKRHTKYWALGVGASLLTAFILLQPMQVWTQTPPSAPAADFDTIVSAIPTPTGCTMDPGFQPLDRVDMNTVIVGTTVKTIHVEKEIFLCDTTEAGIAIFEVSVYTKIFEDMATKTTVKRSFEVITCAKTGDGTVLGCKANVPPTALPTTTNCSPVPVAFPIEMDTVTGTGQQVNIVKTVEAEKELFNCNQPNVVVVKEVIIFTEIYEDMTTKSTVKRTYDSATCIKDVSHAAVIACKGAKIV